MESYIIDIDGTVLSGEKAINGSPAFIENLQKKNINFLLATNSIKAHTVQRERLEKAGIFVSENGIYSPIDSINKFIREKNFSNVWIIGSDSEVNQIQANQTQVNPNLIILLDFEKPNISYHGLQRIIDKVENGCQIVSASRSSYYIKNGQKQLDTGAFVGLIELVTSKKITVLGKPSNEYFLNAKDYFKNNSISITMIGDDWQTDILGAKQVGLRSILIKSGKYQQGDEERSLPDSIIDDLLEINP